MPRYAIKIGLTPHRNGAAMSRPIPLAVQEALDAVHQHHPGVCMVLYLPDGRWLFLDGEGEAPTFSAAVPVDVLEAAADYVGSDPLPVLFFDPDKYQPEWAPLDDRCPHGKKSGEWCSECGSD